MSEINREDCDFIFNLDDPDYELKFNEMIKKFIEKKGKEISKLDDNKEKEKQMEYLDVVKILSERENWIVRLPITPEAGKSKEDIRTRKATSFLIFLRSI